MKRFFIPNLCFYLYCSFSNDFCRCGRSRYLRCLVVPQVRSSSSWTLGHSRSLYGGLAAGQRQNLNSITASGGFVGRPCACLLDHHEVAVRFQHFSCLVRILQNGSLGHWARSCLGLVAARSVLARRGFVHQTGPASLA